MKSPADMLEALGQPFPANAVEKRKGGGGRMYDYVAAETVIRRLNSATNGEWSFVITGHEWRGDVLITWGELTIPGLGTRSGTGVQTVAANAGEDIIKGSASDCLKKCATQFGVALELYGPDLEAGEIAAAPQRAPQRATTPPSAPKPANPSTDTPVVQYRNGNAPPINLSREQVMRALHATGKEQDIDHAGLSALLKAKGHDSMSTAPVEALIDLGKAIKADPGKLKAWLAKQAELMPTPDAVPNPPTANHYTDH